MDILCSDKTGTLTLNKLSVEQDSVQPFGNFSREEVLKYAALSAQKNSEEAIDVVSKLASLSNRLKNLCWRPKLVFCNISVFCTVLTNPYHGHNLFCTIIVLWCCASQLVGTSCSMARLLECKAQAGVRPLVLAYVHTLSGTDHYTDHHVLCIQVLAESYKDKDTLWDNYECPKFIPFNPVDKYTIAIIRDTKSGEMMRVMKGAPQVYDPPISFAHLLLGSSCHCDSLSCLSFVFIVMLGGWVVGFA